MRPTERATWVEVNASPQAMRAWARRAAEAGLSVDVWIAMKLEWRIVCSDMSAERVGTVVNQARREADALRLAPSDELRRWLGFLQRGPQPRAEHDLPSIALPARVLARVPPNARALAVVAAAAEPLEDALVVERAASLHG